MNSVIPMNTIVSRLLEGHVSPFKNSPDQQDAVLLELSSREFPKDVYTPQFHKKFLGAISSKVTVLTLKNNPLQTDDELMELIKRIPRLQKVILEDCPNVKGFTSPVKRLMGGNTPAMAWVEELCKRGIKTITIVDSGNTLDPALQSLIPQLQSRYPNVNFDIRSKSNSDPSHPSNMSSASSSTSASSVAISQSPTGAYNSPRPVIDHPITNLSLQARYSPSEIDFTEVDLDQNVDCSALSILPNGLIVNGSTGLFKLLDGQNKKVVKKIQTYSESLNTLWEMKDIGLAKLYRYRTKLGYKNIIKMVVPLSKGLLASFIESGPIMIWNSESGKLVKTLDTDKQSINSLIEMTNGWLVAGMGEGVIQIFDVESGKVVKTLKGGPNISQIFELTNNRIVTNSDDKTIPIWNVETGELKILNESGKSNTPSPMSTIAVLPNGMVASSEECDVHIWDIERDEKVKSLIAPEWPKSDYVLKRKKIVYTIVVLPNGAIAVISNHFGVSSIKYTYLLTLWNVERGREIRTLYFEARGLDTLHFLALATNGELISASEESIKCWPICEYKLEPGVSESDRFQYLTHHPIMLLLRNQLRVEQVSTLFPESLEEIDVSHTFITDEHVKAILEQCPRLKKITHEGCGWLTQDGLDMIAARQGHSISNNGKAKAVASTASKAALASSSGSNTQAIATVMTSLAALASEAQRTEISDDDLNKKLMQYVETMAASLSSKTAADYQAQMQSIKQDMQKQLHENVQQQEKQKIELEQLRAQLVNASGELHRDLEIRISTLEGNQNLLMQDYNTQQAILAQKEYILSQQELARFYGSAQNRLQNLFLAYKVIGSGLVVHKPLTTTDAAVKFILLAGNAIPIPGSQALATWVGFGIKTAAWLANRKNGYDNMIKINDINEQVISFRDLDELTEKTSRTLTLMYKEQLKHMTPDSAGLMAEVAVKLMIAYLWEGEFQNRTLHEQLVGSVARILPSSQGQKFWQQLGQKFSELKDKFNDSNITTLQPGDHWTAYGAFQRPGLEITVNSEKQYFSGGGTQPEIYGYRQGTLEEAQAAGLIQTPDRVPSHVQASLSKSANTQILAVTQSTKAVETKADILSAQLLQEQARRIELEKEMERIKQQVALLGKGNVAEATI